MRQICSFLKKSMYWQLLTASFLVTLLIPQSFAGQCCENKGAVAACSGGYQQCKDGRTSSCRCGENTPAKQPTKSQSSDCGCKKNQKLS